MQSAVGYEAGCMDSIRKAVTWYSVYTSRSLGYPSASRYIKRSNIRQSNRTSLQLHGGESRFETEKDQTCKHLHTPSFHLVSYIECLKEDSTLQCVSLVKDKIGIAVSPHTPPGRSTKQETQTYGTQNNQEQSRSADFGKEKTQE